MIQLIMHINVEVEPLTLQFDSVQEILTARRVVAAYCPNSDAHSRLDTLVARSLENWSVYPHEFADPEAFLIYSALKLRGTEGWQIPTSPGDAWEEAHARYMVKPYENLAHLLTATVVTV